jgi:outer membrane lipopolysaccharide assembly protein LptE/RlpB
MIMISPLFRKLLFVVLLASPHAFLGCGYHVAGKAGGMPGGISSLSIPVFVNSTAKPDIEATLTSAFTKEFLSGIDIKEGADARLVGEIRSYSLSPVSYTRSDLTQEYRLSMRLSIRVISKDGAVLWKDDNITDYEDFAVNASDVSATRDAEEEALLKLSADTARLTKERMLEGF